MTPEAFVADRSADLGDFLGPIIGGIYEGIRQGIYDRPGEYAERHRPPAPVLQRLFLHAPHLTTTEMPRCGVKR